MLEHFLGTLRLAPAGSSGQLAEAAVTASLAALRTELARQWLELPLDSLEPAYVGRLGDAHRCLRNGSALYLPRTDADEELLERIKISLGPDAAGWFDPRPLLAAMLYLQPHEFPRIVPLEVVPAWLLDDYAKFTEASPGFFQQVGEADAYARQVEQWLDYLNFAIVNHPDDQFWINVRNRLFYKLNIFAAYFNSFNLRNLFRQRAEILEFALRSAGFPVDHRFPPRANRPRLRLGILVLELVPSAEIFAVRPYYERLDRQRFEILVFVVRPTNAPYERDCLRGVDHFVPLPADLLKQVEIIRGADLDFLLVGANLTSLLLSVIALALHRLARIQITLPTSCVTSGMRHMDYYLSGRLSEPDAAQAHYTERLLLIDGPAHCFDFTGEDLPAPSQRLDRKSFEIPDDAIVFASGANFHKIIPEVERAWIEILARVPGSRLLLYPFNLNWSKSYPAESFLERFRAAAASRGVSDQRLLVFPAAPNRADVFERLRLADLYLDTFPFSGATSLLDPLRIGLLVIAMDGASFRARVGPALLRAIGLDELVAPDSGAYVELACRLARDPLERESLRARLGKAMSARPKFLDSHWFGAQVTEILTKVWAERES